HAHTHTHQASLGTCYLVTGRKRYFQSFSSSLSIFSLQTILTSHHLSSLFSSPLLFFLLSSPLFPKFTFVSTSLCLECVCVCVCVCVAGCGLCLCVGADKSSIITPKIAWWIDWDWAVSLSQ